MPVSTLLQSKSLQVTFGLSGLTEKSHMLSLTATGSRTPVIVRHLPGASWNLTGQSVACVTFRSIQTIQMLLVMILTATTLTRAFRMVKFVATTPSSRRRSKNISHMPHYRVQVDATFALLVER